MNRLVLTILVAAILFLAAFHLYADTGKDIDCVRQCAAVLHIDPPALAYDETLPYRALYTWSTVILREVGQECAIIFHELVHHRQFRDAGGPALDSYEHMRREINARRLEIMFRGHQP